MVIKKKIIICGDTHGYWGHLNSLIADKHPDIILQCGDWGHFPHFHDKYFYYTDAYGKRRREKWNHFGIKNKNTKIYWIAGNHDNHDDLAQYNKITELQPNIYYCPFGSVLSLPTGEKVLMVGGALSIDREIREEGIDWWSQETISQGDMDNLPDTKIDIILSHTIPRKFIKYLNIDQYSGKHSDPSCVALDIIYEKYKPKMWYSGHFHRYKEQYIDDCYWISLNMSNQHRWWVYHK